MVHVKSSVVAVAVLLSFALVGAGCEDKKGLRITNIEPDIGSIQGGDQVTISGTGFETEGVKGVKVYFGDKVAKVLSFQGDNKLMVLAPAVPPDMSGKSVDISMIFDDARTFTHEKAFTYTERGNIKVDDLVKKKDE